jgi:hypothetical protein
MKKEVCVSGIGYAYVVLKGNPSKNPEGFLPFSQ